MAAKKKAAKQAVGCDCIAEVNTLLADSFTELDIPFSFSTGRKMTSCSVMTVATKPRKKAVRMFASFCPFCGVKYS